MQPEITDRALSKRLFPLLVFISRCQFVKPVSGDPGHTIPKFHKPKGCRTDFVCPGVALIVSVPLPVCLGFFQVRSCFRLPVRTAVLVANCDFSFNFAEFLIELLGHPLKSELSTYR